MRIARPTAAAAGERGVVGAHPAAQRNLQAQHAQRGVQPPAHRGRGGQADGHVGGAPRHPGQQRERQQPAHQVGHHDHRLEQQGHRPLAQQRLEDDHRQGQRGGAGHVHVGPSQRRQQQHRLSGPGQRERGADVTIHIGGDGRGHQHRGAEDLRRAEPAPARGQQRQGEHQHAEDGGDVAVHLLAPGLVVLERADLAGGVVGHFGRRLRPCGAAIAGGPVRAAEAGVGQAHEGAEDHHAQGQHHGQPGDAMEVSVKGRPG